MLPIFTEISTFTGLRRRSTIHKAKYLSNFVTLISPLPNCKCVQTIFISEYLQKSISVGYIKC